MTDLSIFLAFTAGLLSFLSPCVLPLIPSWLCFLGGAGLENRGAAATLPAERFPAEGPPGTQEAGGQDKTGGPGPVFRPRLTTATAGFILGFSAVFMLLSIFLSGALFLMGGFSRIINLAAGIIVVVLGLNICFNFLKFLNYEKRFHPTRGPRNIAGAFLVGVAFGAGWTPCVGPILGSILLLAGQSGTMGRALVYLTAYSAGLGLPFLAAAIFFDRLLERRFFAALGKHLPLIQKLSGILLIGIGILILSGQYQVLSAMFARLAYNQSWGTGE
jgi:cytochrome c-type biogenesis protein